MKSDKLLIGLMILIATGVLWIASPFILVVADASLNSNPGKFDRARFEGFVLEVRALNLKPNSSIELRIDDFNNPKSLCALKPDEMFGRGLGAGAVWTEVTADYTLKVTIETRDRGHAGEFGFAYSDTPLILSDGTLNVPGRLYFSESKSKIDDYWWIVENRMD